MTTAHPEPKRGPAPQPDQVPAVLDGWRVATRLLLLVAAAMAGLSMLGHLGRWWWIFDLAAALRPQYAAALALTTVLLFAVGARRAALALAVVALVEVAMIVPLWIAAGPAADSDASLRVHFHNVHGGGDERFAEVARELASGDADVVFLAETPVRWMGLFDDAEVPYELVYPRRSQDHRQLLALSRLPVDGAEAVPLTADSRSGGIAVDLSLDGRPLRLLGLHARAPRDADSSALRDAEFDAVGNWVDAQSVPVAVLGDLNATGWSHPFRRLKRHSALQDSQRGFGLQPTWRDGTGPLMVPLDHLLHERDFTVVDRSTGPALGSTHRSLQVTLGWRADG